MIPYVEIKDKFSLKTIAIVEPQECWFELSYQDVGAFEIYCRASKANLAALQKWRYVKIPNKRFIWLITSVRYTFTAGGARMISATGYEAKWLLHRRCIQTPKELQGTITSAVYGLVNSNLGEAASAARMITDGNGRLMLQTDTNELLIDISGTQAARGNLGEFVAKLLKTYNCGDIVTFEDGALKYKVYTGEVKTRSVRFSQSLDNLLASEYLTDDSGIATNALVVSTVEDVDYIQIYDTGATGIDRAEVLVNSNLSTKYEDASGTERETTPTSDLYKGWQTEEGKNALAEHTTLEDVSGEIDITNSSYKFDVHFFLGDLVGIQDEYFNFYTSKKIAKYTFKQVANGYGENADYGG